MSRVEVIRELSERLRALPLTASVRQLRLLGAALVRGFEAHAGNARQLAFGDEIEALADHPRPLSEGWANDYGRRLESQPLAYYLFADTPDRLTGEIRRHVTRDPEYPPATALALLRDVLDNVFNPVAFDPAWRTEAVVGLARGMYESRDFAPMPVLADALEDAGCAAAAVLAHCRGPGPHARGCWVVDLVLGKA